MPIILTEEKEEKGRGKEGDARRSRRGRVGRPAHKKSTNTFMLMEVMKKRR